MLTFSIFFDTHFFHIFRPIFFVNHPFSRDLILEVLLNAYLEKTKKTFLPFFYKVEFFLVFAFFKINYRMKLIWEAIQLRNSMRKKTSVEYRMRTQSYFFI